MVEAGYSVFANADASGTVSTLTRDISNKRMFDAGVQVVSPFSIFGELMRDWRTPPEGDNAWSLLAEIVPAADMLARSHGSAVTDGEVFEGQDEIPW